MKKILSLMLLFFMLCTFAEAKNVKHEINNIIRNSKISQDSISISIKDIDTGMKIYSLNDKILTHPASVQKMLTIIPIAETLGENYNFSTELYKRGNNGYLIKLGADPYLNTSDLEALIKNINSSAINKIYIDDTIIEQKDWGEGWQWDDDLNTLMPRFNSYNLDGNRIKLTVMKTEPGKQALIINPSKYPLAFLNNVVTGDKNEVKISRDNITASNAIKLDGTVSTTVTKVIPNNNLKRYFNFKLTNALEDRRIYLKAAYEFTTLNNNDEKVTEIVHPLNSAIDDVLKNSNNMAIETMNKLAANKYYKKTGTDTDGLKIIYNYYNKIGMDSSRIRLVDASGVSKNNLVDSDFVSEFLLKNKDNKILEHMATSGEGTLTNRLIPLKNSIKAKTGTLSDISSIAGYLTSKDGHKYAFCIMINDPSSSESAKKILEDYIIRTIYFN